MEFLNENIVGVMLFIPINLFMYGGGNVEYESIWKYKFPIHMELLILYPLIFMVYFIVNSIYSRYGKPEGREKTEIIKYTIIILLFLIVYKVTRVYTISEMIIGVNIVLLTGLLFLCGLMKVYSKDYIDKEVEGNFK